MKKTRLTSLSSSVISTSVCATALVLGLSSLAYADTLTRQLQLGMSGSDVGSLQSFLALDTAIYPQGLVTNYFGFLTKSAVSNFQSRNGIDAIGRVGPITLNAINAQMEGGSTINTGDINAPIIYNTGVTTTASTAVVHWNTNENAAGLVYYSTVPMRMNETVNDVTVMGTSALTDTLLRSAQNVLISNLASNTTYYYIVYTRDGSGNVQVTSQSTFKTQ